MKTNREIEAMSEHEVFEAVKAGEMTYEQFETWNSEQRNKAYSEGAAAESYSNAMSYMDRGE